MATQEEIDQADCFSLGIDAQIFVEGDADTVFWSAVFRHFAPSLKIRLYPSGGNSSLRGCVELEKILDRDGVNQYRILCFDSDYLRYWTGNVRYDLPFILQTYTYAFDNYNTLPQRLNEIIESVTRETDSTKINFDFQQFLLDYSKTVYPLFVYFVAKRKIDKHCAKPEFSNQTIFQQPFSNYNKIIKDIGVLVLNQINADYTTISTTEYDATAAELKDIYGINETNTWLFIRGHDMQDKVVFALLDDITKHISNQKISEYTTKKATDPTFETILQQYINHLGFDIQKSKKATIEEQEIQLNESRKRKINTLLNDAFRYAITDTACAPMQKIGVKISNIATFF